MNRFFRYSLEHNRAIRMIFLTPEGGFRQVNAVVEGMEDYLVAYRDHSLLVCRLHDEQQIKVWIEGLK